MKSSDGGNRECVSESIARLIEEGRFKISVLLQIIALPKITVTLCGLFLKSSFKVSRFAFLGEKIRAKIPSRIISKGYGIYLSSL